MLSHALSTVRDLSFAEYQQRQLWELSPERIAECIQTTRPANHFRYKAPAWVPLEYEGAAIVTMLDSIPANLPLVLRLAEIRKEFVQRLGPEQGIYFLPVESFHQTVANMLSGDLFKSVIVSPGLEEEYFGRVKSAFDLISALVRQEPIRMRMVGISVFGTAIGVLGTFDHAGDYENIIRFRSAFYADHGLAPLGVRMTRSFVGHVTLAYFERDVDVTRREELRVLIHKINRSLKIESNYFNIVSTEFRRYHHLAEFISEPNYPVFNFCDRPWEP